MLAQTHWPDTFGERGAFDKRANKARWGCWARVRVFACVGKHIELCVEGNLCVFSFSARETPPGQLFRMVYGVNMLCGMVHGFDLSACRCDGGGGEGGST